jgi:tryptophan 2,3-dioxygenase
VDLSYSSYLKLGELLRLQKPISEGPEHDEVLFIVVHQVYELWFKQVLHELKLLQLALDNSHTPTVIRTLKRILTIFRTLTSQVDILETMTPVSFHSFRDRLEIASGLQSGQFRELEFTLGLRDVAVLEHYADGSAQRQRLEALLHRPSLYDSLLRYLVHGGYDLPKEALERDLTRSHEDHPAVQEVLVTIYHKDPAAWQVCELLVDLDEMLQAWRYRHLKMVERTVGDTNGSDGGSGVEYLRSTLARPLFPDLWAIRIRL